MNDHNSTSSERKGTIRATRRAMLSAALMAPAVAGLAAAGPPGQPVLDMSQDRLQVFARLSAALTGVAAAKLAPAVDPIDVISDYFRFLADQMPDLFDRLLQHAQSVPVGTQPAAEADAILSSLESDTDPNVKFGARSIVLLWYLGAWYPPDGLKKIAEGSDRSALMNPARIVSAKAYTQGWIWQVMQAHPMGYTTLQFGYWGTNPAKTMIQLIGGGS